MAKISKTFKIKSFQKETSRFPGLIALTLGVLMLTACQPMTALETSPSQITSHGSESETPPAAPPATPPVMATSVPTRGTGGLTGRRAGSCTGGRVYNLYVPSSYNDQTPMPLVAAMHGLGGNYQSFDETSRAVGWHQLAESRGFIFMSPAPVNATRQSFLSFRSDGSADLDAIKTQMNTLLECIYRDVGARYNVETTRIDWIGFSEGASFVGVAASLLSGKLHGVGLYAGSAQRLAANVTRRIPLYYAVGVADAGYDSITSQVQLWSSHPVRLSSLNAGHSFGDLNSLLPPATVYDWISQNATEPVVSGF